MAEPIEPELSPQAQLAITLEQIREMLPTAVSWGESEEPVIDLEVLARLLVQKGISYLLLNREAVYAELGIIREEQNVQTVKKANSLPDEAEWDEADRRLTVLREREQAILDRLWPIPK